MHAKQDTFKKCNDDICRKITAQVITSAQSVILQKQKYRLTQEMISGFRRHRFLLGSNPHAHVSSITCNAIAYPKLITILFNGQNIFFFRPFPSIRGSHSVLSVSKPFYFQRASPSQQLTPYLLSLHLKIFSLISLFSFFPVTPFLSSFFLHTLGLFS